MLQLTNAQSLTNSPTYNQSPAAAAALQSPAKPAAEPIAAAAAEAAAAAVAAGRGAPLRRAGERGGLKFGFQKVRDFN